MHPAAQKNETEGGEDRLTWVDTGAQIFLPKNDLKYFPIKSFVQIICLMSKQFW